jgi:methyl-accepting chemotaxis protein
MIYHHLEIVLMPIDTGLVMQYFALVLGVAGVALALSYPQAMASRLRTALSSSSRKAAEMNDKIDEVTARLDEVTAKLDDTAKSVATVNNNIRIAMKRVEDLGVNMDRTNGRIDRLSKEMITANYNIKREGRELADLSSTVENINDELKSLNKSGSELETEVNRLGRVTLWTERSLRELKDQKKHPRNITRNGNHKRLNTGHNGKANHVDVPSNGKDMTLLVEEKTV